MYNLSDHGLTNTATLQERLERDSSWFDADVDPTSTLAPLLERLGANLERILGPELTKKALAQVVGGSEDWREALADPSFLLSTELGERLGSLKTYAVFGVLNRHSSIERVQQTVQIVEAILLDCLPEHWLPEAEQGPLLPIIQMARARLNLDNGVGVDPEGLALLGGVKLSRIRNMMSGATPELPKDFSGQLSNEAVRAWLEKRDCFLPTLQQPGSGSVTPEVTSDIDPIFVPVARDGSMFTPNVHRNGSYQIGEKGDEETLRNYDEALSRLQAMSVARWRRPNENGNWGIVAAIEWRRVDRNSF